MIVGGEGVEEISCGKRHTILPQVYRDVAVGDPVVGESYHLPAGQTVAGACERSGKTRIPAHESPGMLHDYRVALLIRRRVHVRETLSLWRQTRRRAQA